MYKFPMGWQLIGLEEIFTGRMAVPRESKFLNWMDRTEEVLSQQTLINRDRSPSILEEGISFDIIVLERHPPLITGNDLNHH